MNKKSILLIILCALILSPLILAIGEGQGETSPEQDARSLTIKAKQSNETNYVKRPKEFLTVKDFIKLAELHRIQRIEVYYSRWTALRYGNWVHNEEELRNKEFHSKSIIKDPFTDLSTIKVELEELIPIPTPIYRPDYRLGFVAQDTRGRELILSFVYDKPVMSVNGKQYRASPKLVASVINFLPHTSYDRINKELVLFWHARISSLYKQKNEPGRK
jgi:hypothetical protein